MVRAGGPGLILAAVVLLLAAAACVQQLERQTSTPVASPTAEPTVQLTEVPSPTPTATATPPGDPGVTPTASATPTNIPVNNGTQVGLFLEIEGISDDSIVRGNTVVVRGQTVRDAVVSINTIIIAVNPDGSFEVLLALLPGPNLIEVVVSNLEGEELSREIAVIALPEETPTPTPTPQGGTPS